MNYNNYTQAENEFFAENELIQILPNFREDQFNFVSGNFGPFRPAKPVSVPLWLAVYLKTRNKCQVQVPKWLDYEYLCKIKLQEKELADTFSEEIPFYYFEVASLLFNNCADEFQNVQKMKSIIEDIFELRSEKLIRMLKNIEPGTPVKFLSHAAAVEVNTVRPAFVGGYSIANSMQNIIEQCKQNKGEEVNE